MTDDEIKVLELLENATKPGLWHYAGPTSIDALHTKETGITDTQAVLCAAERLLHPRNGRHISTKLADYALAVAARNALPKLLAERARIREALKHVAYALDHIDHSNAMTRSLTPMQRDDLAKARSLLNEAIDGSGHS